jgi:type IV pilus assembly protein PilB
MLKDKIEAELRKGAQASVIKLVDLIILQAYRSQASDIHLDPQADTLAIRFRLDGIMQPLLGIPKVLHSEIIARIKILAGLRTDEHNAAQDGRIQVRINNLQITIRVSILPTYYGENAVLRLLTNASLNLALTNLGLSPAHQKLVAYSVQKTGGLILVTGPTGSGKTTTLYSCLQLLDSASLSIITLEDPIEYTILNTNQVPINQQSGLTFNNGLRAILRQDPDVIMIGEIRDRDTARLAINAALTGHLILSTLHTNNALGALPRLIDMGIEPYLIAATVKLIISQRLVRKICSSCTQKQYYSSEQWLAIASSSTWLADQPPASLWTGQGCAACSHTGYSGRTGIYELLPIDEVLRAAITSRSLTTNAELTNFTPMFADGWNKVKSGITTLSELNRVIYD